MSYDSNTPQATDIPRDSQQEFLTNFNLINSYYGLDHIPFGDSIFEATLENPCVITVPNHRFETGQNLTINNLHGINLNGEREAWSLNGNTYACVVNPDKTIQLTGADATNEPAYESNSGDVKTDASDFYGYHKKVTFAVVQDNDPNKSSPISSLYTKKSTRFINPVLPDFNKTEDFIDLFFQNASDVIYRLTGATFDNDIINQDSGGPGVGQLTITRFAFNTPFGVKFNFGRVVQGGSPANTNTIPLLLTLNSAVYTVQATRNTDSSGTFKVTATSLNDVTFNQSVPLRGFQYMVIGV